MDEDKLGKRRQTWQKRTNSVKEDKSVKRGQTRSKEDKLGKRGQIPFPSFLVAGTRPFLSLSSSVNCRLKRFLKTASPCIPNYIKVHILLLPSTNINRHSPVKYYYKNNRQRVVKVYEFC